MIDPVAMFFTEERWCYVVEMREKPLGLGDRGESGGCVRRLRDLDGLGRADESIFFRLRAELVEVNYTVGLGVLVAAAPDIR